VPFEVRRKPQNDAAELFGYRSGDIQWFDRLAVGGLKTQAENAVYSDERAPAPDLNPDETCRDRIAGQTEQCRKRQHRQRRPAQ
jgi:hypothetical protein